MNPPSEHDHGLQVRSGRPLFYAPLIQNLKLKKTYSHIDVVNFGEKRGLFKKEPLKGKGTVNYARQAMLSFSKRNLGTPDNIRPVSEKKTANEWYGWRWKRALSATYFSEEEWLEIEDLEARDSHRKMLWHKVSNLWTMIKSRKLAISTALVLGFGIAAAEHFRPAEMWKVLLAEGPGAALYWLADPRTNQEKFAKAWNLYLQGDLGEAAAENEPLLNLKVESKTKGDAFYLAGLLAAREFVPETMNYFFQALDIYEEREAYNSLYNAHLTIANYYLRVGDPTLALSYLKRTDSIPASRPNLGYYFEVKLLYEFKSGLYKDALASAQESLMFYQGQDANATAKLLTAVGFFQILNGQYSEGLQTSIDAQDAILKIENQSLFFFNRVNFYLLEKCRGQGSELYRKSILKRISLTGDALLKEKFEFAQSFSCLGPEDLGGDEKPSPPEPIEDDTPPPPPPDG